MWRPIVKPMGMSNMEEQQLLKEKNHEITVSAEGTSLQDAVGKIFQIMRKRIFAEFGKPIIHMEAEEVYFDKVDTQRRTEHFMLFFWPKEKVSYTITARIVVKIKYLDIKEES